MAKYDVAERFKQVAKNSEDLKKRTGGSVFGSLFSKKKQEPEPTESKESLRSSFHKQFGSTPPRGGNVNLPNEMGTHNKKKQGLGPSFMR